MYEKPFLCKKDKTHRYGCTCITISDTWHLTKWVIGLIIITWNTHLTLFSIFVSVEINICLFYSSVHSIGANITVDTGSCNEASPGVYLPHKLNNKSTDSPRAIP